MKRDSADRMERIIEEAKKRRSGRNARSWNSKTPPPYARLRGSFMG